MILGGWLIDIADIIDIAIVALFLYAGLVWFKRTRAFLVVIGIVFLGVVYALARFFNLFLTTAILQGFFAVFLIAIIIIFQEEIRHFFERIALWGLGRRRRREATPIVEAIVRAASDLARARMGALIAIAGQDPVDRHLEGGTELDGKVSEPLLKSIFDPSSPGHDGAVIIEGGRVVRFAVYLPLSKDLEKLAGTGTRHAAALGLAERCDAMCIIVSEERGAISTARDGEIFQVKDIERLAPLIDGYLAEKFPPREKRRISNIVRHNFKEKAIALFLAVAIWAIFASRAGIVQRDFVVPVEYSSLPAGLSIEHVSPRELTATLSGDERAFRLFSPENLKATVDLSGAREGRQRVPVRKDDLSRIPHNLSLDNIRPEGIDVTLRAGEKR